MSRLLKLSGLVLALLFGSAGQALAADAPSPAVAAVAALYRDIAWQAVIDKPLDAGPALLEQGRDQLRKYFDAALADLIVADRACTARGQGICGLDFDPLWNSQDPVGARVSITQGSRADEVLVTVAYPKARDRKPMVFQMAQASGGWRVSDIRFPGEKKTLKAILQPGK